MAWVQRKAGVIVGVYNNRQPGYAEEELADDHSEVVAYRTPPDPDYREKRRREYPPVGDQLDALWKGGADADAMKAIIVAVKLKYPKPN